MILAMPPLLFRTADCLCVVYRCTSVSQRFLRVHVERQLEATELVELSIFLGGWVYYLGLGTDERGLMPFKFFELFPGSSSSEVLQREEGS